MENILKPPTRSVPRTPRPRVARKHVSRAHAKKSSAHDKHKGTPAKIDDDKGEEAITVVIRVRPLNTRESGELRSWSVQPHNDSIKQIMIDGGQPVMGENSFLFDKTFNEDTSTQQIYDTIAKPIVDSAMNGLNGTIFAYGQTSSGKTYTMQGSGSMKEDGMVHMVAKDIFSYAESNPDCQIHVRASFMEIYKEKVLDLLGDNSDLTIQDPGNGGVVVSGVNEREASSYRGLWEIFCQGESNRAIAATDMNERSSRSHTIFRITIESQSRGLEKENDQDGADCADQGGPVRVSSLYLVDLAGSESIDSTTQLIEGATIRKSLSTLSRVMISLGQNADYIPYRDSKLTQLLKPSLSGNARLALVCCVTLSNLSDSETRSTLKFGSRAKLVKTNAPVNEVSGDCSALNKLQRKLAEAKKNGGDEGQEAVEFNQARKTVESLESRIMVLQLESSKLEKENAALFDKLGTRDIKKLEKENAALSDKLGTRDVKISLLEEAMGNQVKENQQLSAKHKLLESQVETLGNKLSQLTLLVQLLQEKQSEVEKLRSSTNVKGATLLACNVNKEDEEDDSSQKRGEEVVHTRHAGHDKTLSNTLSKRKRLLASDSRKKRRVALETDDDESNNADDDETPVPIQFPTEDEPIAEGEELQGQSSKLESRSLVLDEDEEDDEDSEEEWGSVALQEEDFDYVKEDDDEDEEEEDAQDFVREKNPMPSKMVKKRRGSKKKRVAPVKDKKTRYPLHDSNDPGLIERIAKYDEQYPRRTFEQWYDMLKMYHEVHDHCRVKGRTKLGNWVCKIRRDKDSLSKERKKLLGDIGFDWPSPKLCVPWEERYSQLKAFYEENRHCKVPKGETKKLNDWCSIQRYHYKCKKPYLTKDRIGQLNRIGFDWSSPKVPWEVRYSQLKAFYEKNRHCKVPYTGLKTRKLSDWCSNQRHKYKKRYLSESQIRQLNRIQFPWKVQN